MARLLNKLLARGRNLKHLREILFLQRKYTQNIVIENGTLFLYFLRNVVHAKLYEAVYRSQRRRFINSNMSQIKNSYRGEYFVGDRFNILTKFRGVDMNLNMDFYQIYLDHIYEKHFIFNNFIEEGETFFDLGANVGIFGVYMGTRKNSYGYLFEPSTFAADLLEMNVKENDLMERLTVVRMAASDKTGKIYFHNNTSMHTMSFTSKEPPRKGDYSTVDCITIDDFVRTQNLTVHAIKLDLEGHERIAFDGMRDTLIRQKPRLAVSAYHLPDDIPVLLRKILEVNPSYKIVVTADILYAS